MQPLYQLFYLSRNFKFYKFKQIESKIFKKIFLWLSKMKRIMLQENYYERCHGTTELVNQLYTVAVVNS